MQKKLSRRTLLKTAILASGGTLVACMQVVQEPVENMILKTAPPQEAAAPLPVATTQGAAAAQEAAAAPTTTNYLPVIKKEAPTNTPTPGAAPTRTPLPPGSRSRVMHIRANNATNWNYSAQNYWDYVNQGVVDNMVDEGVMNLTGQRTLADAWRSLMPNYSQGQVVAIKVCFNNSHDSAGSVNQIDGIIEPVNSIIRGLKAAGVSYSSIVVYDSSRALPTRFTSGCDYPGVQFKDKEDNPWGSTRVTFTPRNESSFEEILSDVVVNADYLINVPIMKYHTSTRFSLAMKNHYGSVNDPNKLHAWSSIEDKYYSSQYSPIVDINKNQHIAGKTILNVGDAIFASHQNFDTASFPRRWAVFNNDGPKSLFFSVDPVAIDCVMGEYVAAEWGRDRGGTMDSKGFLYMEMAAAAGLGIYERGDPWQNTYKKIDYQKIEL